jgi:hypothetical protein
MKESRAAVRVHQNESMWGQPFTGLSSWAAASVAHVYMGLTDVQLKVGGKRDSLVIFPYFTANNRILISLMNATQGRWETRLPGEFFLFDSQ